MKLFVSSLFVTAALLAQTPAPAAGTAQPTDKAPATTKVAKKHKKGHVKKSETKTTPDTTKPAAK